MSEWRVLFESAALLAIGVGLWWLSPPWSLIVVGALVLGACLYGRMVNRA